MVGRVTGEVIGERPDHTERFAAYLRMLKNRSGLGFHQLGKLAAVSSSSLHRYCSGASVPQDYRIVLSFAKACGATTEEIRHLHRLWSAAEAVRRTDPSGRPPVTVAADDLPPDAPGDTRTADDPAPDDTRPQDNGSHGVVPDGAVPSGAVPSGAVPDEPAGDDGERVTAPGRRRGRYLVLAAICVAVVLAAAGLLALRVPADPGPAGDDRMLFSRACQDPVSMGQYDQCVREVQNLLVKAGGQLAVDGSFGPETLRRVTAFQVLAGLPARGVVDDATKEALYAQRVRIETWPRDRVESRIREVFPEDPDHAVAIARCQSRLDPLHITPNTNGSRNWGLFQLSDSSLKALEGTPAMAFDPEWNITAARQLWSSARDFRHWPFCEAALNASPPPTTVPAIPGR